MNFPVVDLNTPTRLMFEWGWFLMTRANFVVFALLFVIFVLGATVRMPGTRRHLATVEAEGAPVDGDGAGRSR